MRFLLISLTACALAACAAAGTVSPAEGEAPIIGGASDTAHPSTVLLNLVGSGGSSACSGTIIQADPRTKIGHVLTAGHCVRDYRVIGVVRGSSILDPNQVAYKVVEAVSDPAYDGALASPHDVAVVRIEGVSESTPVTPMAHGTFAAGTPITTVGFGRSAAPGADAGNPMLDLQRRALVGTITGADERTVAIAYPPGTSSCSGDSGGPNLALEDGREVVVSVSSVVGSNCNGTAGTVRPSPFVAAYVASVTEPPASCERCRGLSTFGDQPCSSALQACIHAPDCRTWYRCALACAAGDSACRAACTTANPAGAPLGVAATETCPAAACTSECR